MSEHETKISNFTMSDEDFFKKTVYLLCGKNLLNYIDQNTKCCLNNENRRIFLIGILIAGCDENASEEIENINVKKANPFELGCVFGNKLKKNDDLDKLFDVDKTLSLWKTQKLYLPENIVFLSSLKNISSFSYLKLYDEMRYKLLEIEKATENNNKSYLVSDVVAKCGVIAEDFFKEKVQWKWKFKNKKKKKNFKNKWEADDIKMQYYESCWLDTIRKITNTYSENVKYEKFFNGLRKEIEDINKRSSDMCTRRNKEQTRIIVFSILATIFNALATGLTSISEYELEKEAGSELWKSIINAAPLITLAISTSFTALFTGFNYFKEHNAYEEAWLRHQLNRSRLTGELEKFCEGLGEYSCINKIKNNPTNNDENNLKDNDKKEIRNAIQTFQKNIYLLRKQDDANFFSNMNCINFDKDDYKFDDNDEDNNINTLMSLINQLDEKVNKLNLSPAGITQNNPNEPVQSSGNENAGKNSNNPDSIEDNSDVSTEVKEKSGDENNKKSEV